MAEGYATKAETPEERTSEPNLDREDLEEVDGTDEIKDVFDAIKLTCPGDIRLQSTETNTRSDGTADYDPSWANSDSGTRLAELEDGTRHDGWIYRKGDHLLDALQVVALEERIITDPTDYPEGSDFWKVVDELRARGARIPEYTGGDKPTCDELELAKEPETVEEEIEQFLMEAELQD